jgi:glycogen debranching enzyme
LLRSRQLPAIVSENTFFNQALMRGMHDLVMMCVRTPQGLYPYGGIPWYVCPFGRDGLITSLEFLPWFPEVARGTLDFLAARQGRKQDPFTEEQPGKILHELRRGELANLREIPFIPYYGTVDATPLFIITLEQYIRWTDDVEFLRRMWPHALAAARWMIDYGDSDGDGFLDYHRSASTGLVNQGWKDSWDAISHADGRLAEGPIALCEAQAYAYAAFHAIAWLAERSGHGDLSAGWLARATQLRANFVEKFWWPEQQSYYLALDGAKEPCKVVNSNAGQCLWAGIAPPEQGEAIVERLMRPDMYTEWGIRTLSSQAARYNPMSYHNGSVWPHDTALIGAGFARYGFREEAARLLGNLYGVSLHYEGARLPELLCGFSRMHGYGPTRYPVACSPQSWAAGAPFLLISAILGFEPDAQQGRLTLRRPTLPEWLSKLEMRGLRVGGLNGRLRFDRSGGETAVILSQYSEIDIHVLPS